MPKVTMDKVRSERVEVEIPDECPECGADFTDEGALNLEEQRYVGYAQTCYLVGPDEDESYSVEMGDCTKNIYDMDLTFCYMCRKCDCIVASTEECSTPTTTPL